MILDDTVLYTVICMNSDSGSSVHYARAGSSPASRTKKTDQPSGWSVFLLQSRDLKSASKNASAAQNFWEQPLIMVAFGRGKSHRERQKERHPKGCLSFWCERWDLNPHVHSNTSTSSLPVCRFQHARIPCGILEHYTKLRPFVKSGFFEKRAACWRLFSNSLTSCGQRNS